MTIRQVGAGLALVVLCAATAQAGDPPPPDVCGDVNETGTVNAVDALLVLKKGVDQPVELVCPAIDALAVCQADLLTCTGDDSCGDGIVNAVGEQCDTSDLGGASCASLAYDLGTLACNGSCTFDATGCDKCAGLGEVYQDACWYIGEAGESCNQVCAGFGQVYDRKTRTVAGSDGTDEACDALLDLLVSPGSLEFPSFDCTYAVGCLDEGGVRGRCASPVTASSGTYVDDSRVCACKSECSGVTYAGACWFLGTNGQSCDTVCANKGLVYSEATAGVAGSEGTDEACQTLLDKLSAPGTGLDFPAASCAFAQGCSVEGTVRGRCASPDTTGAGSYSESARACACE